MKKLHHIFLLFAAIFLLTSCTDDDYELSVSVFIEDPYYPGLPIYSEWGYNTFGAYIDRKPYVSIDEEIPAKIIVNSDTLHMILKGRMGNENVDMHFSIKGYPLATNWDLVELNGKTINLKDPGCSITLKMNGQITNLKIIEGEILVDKVQKLYIDEEPMRIIMSGHFHFKTFLQNEPVAISYGRFDLGIGYENFYNY